jgi:hypothetical protein
LGYLCKKIHEGLLSLASLILKWKKLSEEAALLETENLSPPSQLSKDEDTELIRFYSQCFDRPAFQDPFQQEGSMEAFDRAIEDTIIALNTGTLLARDRTILAQAKGKSYLSNQEWREKMDTIVDLLRAIRSRYSLAVRTGQIHLGSEHDGQQFYVIQDAQVAAWIDSTRAEIIRGFSDLCKEAGIPPLHFPRFFGMRWLHL